MLNLNFLHLIRSILLYHLRWIMTVMINVCLFSLKKIFKSLQSFFIWTLCVWGKNFLYHYIQLVTIRWSLFSGKILSGSRKTLPPPFFHMGERKKKSLLSTAAPFPLESLKVSSVLSFFSNVQNETKNIGLALHMY